MYAKSVFIYVQHYVAIVELLLLPIFSGFMTFNSHKPLTNQNYHFKEESMNFEQTEEHMLYI